MQVQPTPDQQAYIRRAIESGRVGDEEAAVREALSLWEARERSRDEILMALDDAEADLVAGRFADYSDAMLPELAADLKREARSPGGRR